MRDFQRDKQARLNEVPIEVAVRARDVQCATAECLLPPANALDALIIPSSWMERLNSRIQVRRLPCMCSMAAEQDETRQELAMVTLSHTCLHTRMPNLRVMQGLDDEKDELRAAQKDLRRKHVQLSEDKAAREAHVAEQQARCRDVQMLKFGQEIDTALLDTIGTRNRAADELRHALKQQVRSWESYRCVCA